MASAERGPTGIPKNELRVTLLPKTQAALLRLRDYLEAGGEFEEGPEPPGETQHEREDWRRQHAQEDLWQIACAMLSLVRLASDYKDVKINPGRLRD